MSLKSQVTPPFSNFVQCCFAGRRWWGWSIRCITKVEKDGVWLSPNYFWKILSLRKIVRTHFGTEYQMHFETRYQMHILELSAKYILELRPKYILELNTNVHFTVHMESICAFTVTWHRQEPVGWWTWMNVCKYVAVVTCRKSLSIIF